MKLSKGTSSDFVLGWVESSNVSSAMRLLHLAESIEDGELTSYNIQDIVTEMRNVAETLNDSVGTADATYQKNYGDKV